MTPLHYVSLAGDYVNCTCVLVESGASLNETDIDGKTPLHSAVLNERHGIVKYLCEHETDVNAMFLMKNDWVTPYDCAMYRCNVKIAIMLEKCVGLQVQNIKEYAVRLIQSWYKRKKRLTSKAFSYPSSKEKSSNILCSRPVKQNFVPLPKCQICSPTNKLLFFICNECFHKYTLHRINKKVFLNLNKESVDCCSFSNMSLSGSVPGYKLLAFCENPCTCNDLIQLDSVVYNKSFFHVILGEKTTGIHLCCRDRAVRIIQKAWKRYKLKKKFSKVRNEVRLSYINHGKRSTAEEIWQLSFQTFSKKVFE